MLSAICVPKSEINSFMCDPRFCSMKITEDVRKYAARQNFSDDEALKIGIEQDAREFTQAGAEIYSKA